MGETEQFFPLYQARFRSHLYGPASRALAREIALRSTLPRKANGSFDWSRLPPAAASGEAFSAQSRRGAVAVLQGSDTGMWLLRRDSIDQKVANRVWRTEVFVSDDGESDVIGVRASVALGRNMVAPVERSPLIAALVKNCAFIDSKTRVQSRSRNVTTNDVTPVLDLLVAPTRTLPVLLLSPTVGGRSQSDAQNIADRLAGFAHVLVVMPDARAAVMQFLTKDRGVRLDAMTLCWPSASTERGASDMSWDLATVKGAGFIDFLESAVIRSTVGTQDAWLGPLGDRLLR